MEIHTDFLVLGTGIAGLSFAIKASRLGSVAMVTKKDKTDSNTNMAQGGIAVVQDQTDRFEYHINAEGASATKKWSGSWLWKVPNESGSWCNGELNLPARLPIRIGSISDGRGVIRCGGSSTPGT